MLPPRAWTARRAWRSDVRTSDISRGLSEPMATIVLSLPSAIRYRPGVSTGIEPVAVPSPRSFSGADRVRPPGVVTRAARLTGFRLRRNTSRRRSRIRERRYSSSSSGSFISQCETRRSISDCGPPPSKPRSHNQAWSDSNWATRPLPTRSRISSGRSSSPLNRIWPRCPSASIWRNQRPQGSGPTPAPDSLAVTGWRLPRSVRLARKPRR